MFLSSLYLLPSSEAESPKALASLVPCWEQRGSWQKQPTIFLQLSQRFVHTAAEVMEAKLRWGTAQASLTSAHITDRGSTGCSKWSKSHPGSVPGEAFPLCLLWKMRGGEIYSMQREIWRVDVRCPKLCHRQCTPPLERTLDWEELRKKSQVNFKSRIRDFGLYNGTVDAHSFFDKPLFIFFHTKYQLLATC